MGDVSVTLTVRKTDESKVQALINGSEDCLDIYDECIDIKQTSDEIQRVSFLFSEVKYAVIDIEGQLQNERIPYDKEWSEGLECEAGSEYFRILEEGESSLKTHKASSSGMIYLDDLVKSFELNRVEAFIEDMKMELLPISWKQQEQIFIDSSSR